MDKHHIEEHYNATYFNDFYYQLGEFGGRANIIKFAKYIAPEMSVLDFGCGGGFLLNNLNCARKAGVEINPTARSFAKTLGIETYADIAAVPNDEFDLIISNSVLEHCINPSEVLMKLKGKLKARGGVIFCVPNDGHNMRYEPEDVNQHLYSWSPLNLGNLLTACGYKGN